MRHARAHLAGPPGHVLRHGWLKLPAGGATKARAQVLANCPRRFAAAEAGGERRWTRGLAALQIQRSTGSDLAISPDRHRFLASLAPLVVAIIAASGLAWLAFVNFHGGKAQIRFEHAAAIQRLFFRDSH
ncbi:MAG: hypothetical protein ACREFL_20170 [Stellaceae bacterium]